MQVAVHPDAAKEYPADIREKVALDRVITKLREFGERLQFPHTSAVRGSKIGLRELRPRAGRSPWRCFYGRVGEVLLVGAIGPEAQADWRGFDAAVRRAEERIAAYEPDEGEDDGGTMDRQRTAP